MKYMVDMITIIFEQILRCNVTEYKTMSLESAVTRYIVSEAKPIQSKNKTLWTCSNTGILTQ